MGDGMEIQLKELRKQVEENRESIIACEEARTAEFKAAEQKQRIELRSRQSSSIK